MLTAAGATRVSPLAVSAAPAAALAAAGASTTASDVAHTTSAGSDIAVRRRLLFLRPHMQMMICQLKVVASLAEFDWI